jgi:hypothetical protein
MSELTDADKILILQQIKPKWKLDVDLSTSTPYIVVVPSWKEYPTDLFLSEYIIMMRMRGYEMNMPVNQKDLDPRPHCVMFDNKEVWMPS